MFHVHQTKTKTKTKGLETTKSGEQHPENMLTDLQFMLHNPRYGQIMIFDPE